VGWLRNGQLTAASRMQGLGYLAGMQDTELYRHILGIQSPWKVARVALDMAKQRIDVFVERERGSRLPCPVCGAALPVYDHAEERSWRHLDSCQFMTFLTARPPRVDCPEHGVKQVRLPWAEPNSRFTLMFERFAIDVLREASVSGAIAILRIGWDAAWHLIGRAVARGQARMASTPPRVIGLDEKAFARRYRFVTIVCDVERGVVEHVFEGRGAENLEAWLGSLSPQQRDGIEAIAMDMWEPYYVATERWLAPVSEKIVFDRFHVMAHVTKAVDAVRKAENRSFVGDGDGTLLRTKYLWLANEENVPDAHVERFKMLRSSDLRTARAWAIKESLRRLWACDRPAAGAAYWRRWWSWAVRSRLEPIRKAAWTLQRHITGILNYFRHPITNATAEGLNSKIQTLKKRANRFRSMANFKTAIYFHCGGLDLYRRLPTH
jgi:transposase